MCILHTKVQHNTTTSLHAPTRSDRCLLQYLRVTMSTHSDTDGLRNFLHRLKPLLCRSENDSRVIVIMTCGIAGEEVSQFGGLATIVHYGSLPFHASVRISG